MDLSAFQVVFNSIADHSYLFIFGVMVIEGPIVTAAAAFAAALGHLNILIVFALSLLGDMAGDLLYFSIGYWGRLKFVEKYGVRFGLTPVRLERLSHLVKTHPIKVLIASKYIPFVSASGLAAAGLSHISPKRFILLDLLVTLPNTILFTTTGFYFGLAFERLFQYFQNAQYAILIIGGLALILFLLYKKLIGIVYKDLKKEVDSEDTTTPQ